MWRSNHLCNRSVESSSADLQMPHRKHALTSVPEDFGVIASAGHFLTSGCSTRTPHLPYKRLLRASTQNMNAARDVSMSSGCVTSKVPALCRSCFHQPEEWGPACATTFKRLADLLSEKLDCPYAAMLNWLRCRVSFALLRSAVTSLRGSRRRLHLPQIQPLLALTESRLSKSR